MKVKKDKCLVVESLQCVLLQVGNLHSQLEENVLCCLNRVLYHLAVQNTHHPYADGIHLPVTFLIVQVILLAEMATAIHFYNHIEFMAVEIGDIVQYRLLSCESVSCLLILQHLPQHSLRLGSMRSQITCKVIEYTTMCSIKKWSRYARSGSTLLKDQDTLLLYLLH